jgi:hypothetical protein
MPDDCLEQIFNQISTNRDKLSFLAAIVLKRGPLFKRLKENFKPTAGYDLSGLNLTRFELSITLSPQVLATTKAKQKHWLLRAILVRAAALVVRACLSNLGFCWNGKLSVMVGLGRRQKSLFSRTFMLGHPMSIASTFRGSLTWRPNFCPRPGRDCHSRSRPSYMG